MSEAPHVWTAGEEPRVLVIGPNRHHLGEIGRRLGRYGFRIGTADSAHAGIAELYRVPADLVLCEARMPGTSGIELARMIRDDPAHSALPLVLIVGRSDRGSTIRAFNAGADGVVRKPFHFEVLGAAIARQIERARAVQRLADDNAALDAKVISRVLELREVRERLRFVEGERRRLAAMLDARAA